jgi:hypothetical protein
VCIFYIYIYIYIYICERLHNTEFFYIRSNRDGPIHNKTRKKNTFFLGGTRKKTLVGGRTKRLLLLNLLPCARRPWTEYRYKQAREENVTVIRLRPLLFGYGAKAWQQAKNL